jgi:hypothetical protein
LFSSPFSKNRQFREKSGKSLELVPWNFALNEHVLHEFGPWLHLSWPTLR